MTNLNRQPIAGTTARQRAIILDYLREKHRLSTIEAREILGICHPAMRVRELRLEGWNILTHWTYKRDTAGIEHRVANYVLMFSKEVAA